MNALANFTALRSSRAKSRGARPKVEHAPLDCARDERAWRAHLIALAAACAALLLLFHRDAAHMATIWWTSSTFNHALLIPPIVAWLVWQRRPELSQLRPAAWWPPLLLVAVGASAWLLGEAAGVALARHAGLVLMLQGTIASCLGKSVSRGLAFPLFYLLFLIPAGEELVPILQTVTAKMCMLLLGWTGVPAHIEGIFITTPTGYFEVAEACAGAKFLVAMIALGALVANVCFRSWKRRAAFMLAAIVVPILANGVRAFGTIYIAHRTSIEFAESVDHVVYGWFFFAFVIGIVVAAFWRFFDRRVGDPWFDPARLQSDATGPRPSRIAAAALALAALPLLWTTAVTAAGTEPPPSEIPFPVVRGWQGIGPGSGRPWEPNFVGADLVRMARYRDGEGREVDLAIAVFARQEEGRELVGHGQGAAAPDSAWAWTAMTDAPPNGRAELLASNRRTREVVSFYRVGDRLTGSAMAVKLETMKTRLFGGPQRAVAVLVSAEAPGAGLSARPAIDAFLAALGPIEPLADRAAAGR